MRFLDRVFRRRHIDLDHVDGPTRVELDCRVASPDVVVSPVTGTAAALLRFSLLEERTLHGSEGGRGGGAETTYAVLARGLYGRAAVLLAFAGEVIEIPLDDARLVLVEDPADGTLLATVPDSLRSIVQEVATSRPLAYREAFLRQGDHVRLTATLERVRPAIAPGYRSAACGGPALRAITDDRIVLRELGYG